MTRLVTGLMLLMLVQGAAATSLTSLIQAAGLSPSGPLSVAPDFQLSTLDGQLLRLREQRGHVVFLNFWATWCPPCREEMPGMEALFQGFRERAFVMWAVAMQEERKQVMPFLKEHHLHFPVLLDINGAVSAQYAIHGLPTTYLIDCAGDMVGRAVGPRQWEVASVRSLLVALLDDAQCR